MRRWRWILPAILLALPPAAWAGFKPVRILAPRLNGVTCPGGPVCVDDPSRLAEASRLYEEAVAFVDSNVGRIASRPRAVFCATQACFESFGFEKASSQTIGTFGIVIGPRGWAPHLVRHEMIHHLQHERLGSLEAWLFTPKWFIEGMAYSLSGDPRPELSQPWEGYRERFQEWYGKIGKDRLWEAAARL
ncbi:MAG TPA: hypothetical protein VNI57_05530 [Candidatus Saccharimonadales bacterium]|nr:hypothetical protein [Candidatus Saccharimonadales bacterium]